MGEPKEWCVVPEWNDTHHCVHCWFMFVCDCVSSFRMVKFARAAKLPSFILRCDDRIIILHDEKWKKKPNGNPSNTSPFPSQRIKQIAFQTWSI